MNTPATAFVRDTLIPAKAPPPNSVGVVGWSRHNLFSTPLNSVMTIAILAFIVWALTPFIRFTLVDSVWKRFADKAQRRGLAFENRVAADHRVQADRGKLHMVIQNLLANAVSYTESGGSIVVDGTADEPLTVWDSGPQLSEEHLCPSESRPS